MTTPSLILSYASTPTWPFTDPGSTSSKPLRLAILDSSFDPPSRAHYALATHAPDTFDAHLLLLSSKNVDKVPGPGSTSFKDRIAMMELMAKHMRIEAPEKFGNLAVGSLAAATFAEKAPIIQEYLAKVASKSTAQGQRLCTLVFFIGFDTVTRLFMPKYYDNSEQKMHEVLEKFFEGDNCEVICARRPLENVAQKDVADQEEHTFLQRVDVLKYLSSGKLQVVDVPHTSGISSTKIRQLLVALEPSDQQAIEVQMKDLVLQEIMAYCISKQLYIS